MGVLVGLMVMIQYLVLIDAKKYKNLVWDYNLDQKDFEEILIGRKTNGSFDYLWAVKRVLENLNYYEAMSIIPKKTFIKNWDIIKPKMFNKSIVKGYDFLLHRYTVSSTR